MNHLLDRLEAYEFECQAGPLRLCEDWIKLRAALASKAAAPEPVGEAGSMPGTSGFTMACFKSSDVPLGTKLYARPPAAVAAEPVADAGQLLRAVTLLRNEADASYRTSSSAGYKLHDLYRMKLDAILAAAPSAAPASVNAMDGMQSLIGLHDAHPAMPAEATCMAWPSDIAALAAPNASPSAGEPQADAAEPVQVKFEDNFLVEWSNLIADGTYTLTPATHAQPAPQALGAAELSQAARDVLAERRRQVEVEGFTPERDDKFYDRGQLARAGAAYAAQSLAADDAELECGPPPWWPWDNAWWKPASRRRMLEKAAALILADMERLDRAAAATTGGQS